MPKPDAKQGTVAPTKTFINAPASSIDEFRLASLPAVEGPLPGGAGPGPGVTIYICCDSLYLDPHALALARSLDVFSPGEQLHIHVINMDAPSQTLLEDLGASLNYTAVSYTYENKDFGDADISFRRSYYAAIRFVRAYQFLDATGRDLLILDADSLIRGPLLPLFLLLGDMDIALKRRADMPPTHEIMAGILFVRSSVAGRNFLSDVAGSIADQLIDGSAEWFFDQKALHDAFNRVRDASEKPRIGEFPTKYFDWEFKFDTVIWTGKGPRKSDDETYLKLLRDVLSDEQAER